MTNTLVNSPNIEGNIGSCQTFVERATSRDRFWKEQYTEIATNSCTGEVTEYHGYSTTAEGGLLIFGLFFTVLIGIFAWVIRY